MTKINGASLIGMSEDDSCLALEDLLGRVYLARPLFVRLEPDLL